MFQKTNKRSWHKLAHNSDFFLGRGGVFITQILNNRQKYSHEKTIQILIVNTTSSTFFFTIRIIINRDKMGSQAALTDQKRIHIMTKQEIKRKI